MHRVGIDLGGTKIEAVVLDPDGNVRFRQRVDTEQQHGYDHILTRIEMLYAEAVRAIPGEPHSVGLAAPGAISPKTGLLKNANTVCLNHRPLKTDLERRLNRRIAMENDANCFAMAEALHGAGQGQRMVFGVIMGTGCGGGIVHRGELITGPQGIAGEWGHMSMNPQGPRCYCGHRGCVETYLSGGGLEARYAEQHGEGLSLKEIVRRFRSGNEQAGDFMRTFFGSFGRALANLIDVLDPNIVVLGGGVSNIDELYTSGVAEVARCTFTDVLETPIVKNRLGDSGGVIGAALIGV